MKRMICAAAAMVMAVAAFGQNTKDMKTLVAYFSATGTTEGVAEMLAEVTGGDLHEIRPEVKYTDADLDWRNDKSRSSVEMNDKKFRPAMIKDLKDVEKYDTVFIGFPIWWYTAPTIINTFFETYDLSGKNVYFFATSGSSGIEKAVKDFQTAYPDVNLKSGMLLNGVSKKGISTWVERL